MVTKIVLPILAVVGVTFAITRVVRGAAAGAGFSADRRAADPSRSGQDDRRVGPG